VGAEHGVPIFVRQVADVKLGDAFRVAALVKGTEEAVGGVVVARYGVSTVGVIDRVREKIRALEPGLPPGVRIVSFYDRSALIEPAVVSPRPSSTPRGSSGAPSSSRWRSSFSRSSRCSR